MDDAALGELDAACALGAEAMQQAADIPRLIKGPVLYNWVYGGKSPLVHPDQLAQLGYSYCFQADVLFAVSWALQRYFSELKTTGTYGRAQEQMATFDEFNEFIGLAEVIAAERKYGDLQAGAE